MENDYIEKCKEAIDNLANEISKTVIPAITNIWNETKKVLKEIVYKDAEIRKRINIFYRTKSFRIKKKQITIIRRRIWD